MGAVFLARDEQLGGAHVAIKMLRQIAGNNLERRFRNEAMACAQLGNKSIHIVKVTDYGIDNGTLFYVMESLKGQTIAEILHSGPVSLKRFFDIARQICLGLATAHRGISIDGRSVPVIHRDIKPSNIIVTNSLAVGDLVKILDFGIAKLVEPDHQATTNFMGTLAYASPEQMDGCPVDGRSDIYSLGIVMYQMLVGKLPIFPTSNNLGGWYRAHQHQVPSALNADVPFGLKKLIADCLAKDPNHRPQDTITLLKALEDVIPASSGQIVAIGHPGELVEHWPEDKPIANIAFPKVISSGVAIFGMLPSEIIDSYRDGFRGVVSLICTEMPHPLCLWSTGIKRFEAAPKWLHCYLGLEDKGLLYSLIQSGSYRILFFNRNSDDRRVQLVARLKIPVDHKKILAEWMTQSRPRLGQVSVNTSKAILKREFERRKDDDF